MSCRYQFATPAAVRIAAAPSAVRKWRRWPRTLPRPSNDNPLPPGVAARLILVATIGMTVGTAATVVGWII